jgi:prepilin-type N-terminal cleavage/methylation domain-containing protein
MIAGFKKTLKHYKLQKADALDVSSTTFLQKNGRNGSIQHYFFRRKKNSAGFTLIELLIVIAIIAIIASVTFVALDPLTRFQDSRDSARWQDVSSLSSAITVDQIDNGGTYLTAITNVAAGTTYMIGTGTSACDEQYDLGYCDAIVLGDADCIDLSGLVTEGYMGEVPISPNGNGTWTVATTGYTMMRSSTGAITIQACESENSSAIKITR